MGASIALPRAFTEIAFGDSCGTIPNLEKFGFPIFRNTDRNSKRRINYLLRPITLCCALLICAAAQTFAQEKKPAPTPQPSPSPTPSKPTPLAPGQNPTGEQVAEGTIFVYGSRGVLEQIRRNGIERGHITRITGEGRTEEATYERRFVRGADATKDKIRIDQKMPTMEYSLIYGDGRMWGIINGATFTPRQDAAASFMSQQWHSIDALLRYKENGSTVTFVSKDKQKGLDLWVLDLTDKEKRRTRFYISVRSLHILWIEYEEPPEPGATPVKYTKTFHDYRYSQQTLVPYRSVLLAEGKNVQETRVLTVTFGLKLDESIFQNPEAQAGANP